MELMVDEPDLSWIGIGVQKPRALGFQINGGGMVDMEKFAARKADHVHMFATVWIRMRDIVKTNNATRHFKLAFCNKFQNTNPGLDSIIGIMSTMEASL